MNHEPKIGAYYDDEEKNLIEAMEAAINEDDFVPKSIMTPEMVTMYQEAARNTLNEKTVPVTLRVARTDLVRLKARAAREGIPYQTWMKSILHKGAAE
jgi:predicted DNA binding CopG/RHH family protein